MDTNENYHLTRKSAIWRRSLMDFPESILLEILSRLPLKTLLVCKSVCKTFNNLASPRADFNSLYSPHATQALVLRFQDLPSHPTPYLPVLEPEANLSHGLDFSTKFRFKIPKVSDSFSLALRNSCNGLLYLSGAVNNDPNSIIFNPLTNEYVTLPHWDVDRRKWIAVNLLLLGFALGSSKYKVIRIFWESMYHRAGIQVHEVGSCLWRDVGTGHSLGPRAFFVNGTYLNGAAYMIWYSPKSAILIYFDFDEEEIREIPLPMDHSLLQSDNCVVSTGVLRDCLCVGLNIYRGFYDWERFDLWVRRNGDLWSKDYTIDCTAGFTFGHSFSRLRLVRVLSNGKLLMFAGRRDLFCYDPHNNTITIVGLGLEHVQSLLEPVSFIPSFVPLKDQLSTDQVMVQRASFS